jgi:2-dehydro-3-deoxy-D-arabinonate dehydratase
MEGMGRKMRIIRYLDAGLACLGAVTDGGAAYRLRDPDLLSLVRRARSRGLRPAELIRQEMAELVPVQTDWTKLHLLVPLEAPEVWAAGVTYERSREARNAEVQNKDVLAFSYYDQVYDAERPEIFFKSTAARTRGPGETVCIRRDSRWQVPEPELALVIAAGGEIIGYTVGNDMSSRDIEGENPLYLPQAKIWRHSCSFGPAIRLAETVEDPHAFTITCRIYRNGEKVTEGTASTGQMKRRFHELVSWLSRDNVVFDGTVLFTGTCIVPPDDFTLQAGDRIEIDISDIGTLVNEVELA